LRARVFEYENLLWLAARDIVFFSERTGGGGDWIALVNCGDTFCLACADAEELTPERSWEVKTIYERCGWDGVVAWIAKARGEEPLEKLRTSGYMAAREFLDTLLFFD